MLKKKNPQLQIKAKFVTHFSATVVFSGKTYL